MKCMVILCLVVCAAVVSAAPNVNQNALLNEELRAIIRQELAAWLNRLPSAQQSSDYARGKNYAGQAYDNGASGAQGAAMHDAGKKEFHNVGQHHSKVTQINQKESSEDHNIGGSVAFDKSAAAGNRFNKHANGAKNVANDYAQGRQQSDIIYP